MCVAKLKLNFLERTDRRRARQVAIRLNDLDTLGMAVGKHEQVMFLLSIYPLYAGNCGRRLVTHSTTYQPYCE